MCCVEKIIVCDKNRALGGVERPGDERGGRVMNFTFNISIRGEERSDCPKVRSSF